MVATKRRPSKKVMYRRRRLAVALVTLILLAVVVVGAIFGIRALVEHKPWENLPFLKPGPAVVKTPDPLPTVFPTAGPGAGAGSATKPDPSESPTPEVCAAGALELEAILDKTSYGADELPKLTMKVTNVGSVDCLVNIGTSAQRYEVSSGVDVWWRSNDCVVDPTDQWNTIAAGQSAQTESPVIWDRTRSYPDTCDADERPSAPRGATYNLTVKLDQIASREKSFTL